MIASKFILSNFFFVLVPFAIIFAVVFVKFVIEKAALKAFCNYTGLTYMKSSCARRIVLKVCLMTLLAIIKYLVPYFNPDERLKEVEKMKFDSGAFFWSLLGFTQATIMSHVGMIAFLRTYLDCLIYSYLLYHYEEKDETQVLEEKKEEEAKRSSMKELTNNSYINFRPNAYGEMPANKAKYLCREKTQLQNENFQQVYQAQ